MEKSNLIVIIVAIVAIVGIVALVLSLGVNVSAPSGNSAGLTTAGGNCFYYKCAGGTRGMFCQTTGPCDTYSIYKTCEITTDYGCGAR